MFPNQLTLNLVEGSVSLASHPKQHRIYRKHSHINAEPQTATAKTTGGKASPQQPLEYRYTGNVFQRFATEYLA